MSLSLPPIRPLCQASLTETNFRILMTPVATSTKDWPIRSKPNGSFALNLATIYVHSSIHHRLGHFEAYILYTDGFSCYLLRFVFLCINTGRSMLRID